MLMIEILHDPAHTIVSRSLAYEVMQDLCHQPYPGGPTLIKEYTLKQMRVPYVIAGIPGPQIISFKDTDRGSKGHCFKYFGGAGSPLLRNTP